MTNSEFGNDVFERFQGAIGISGDSFSITNEFQIINLWCGIKRKSWGERDESENTMTILKQLMPPELS